MPNADKYSLGVAGWLKNDAAVIFYDQNDIWMADLTGSKDPVNLTNGYGKKHNMVFRSIISDVEQLILTPGSQIILCAFDRNNNNSNT